MTGTQKKVCNQQQERKTKSGLSTLKKKLNIPKIYRRLASKLSVHGRQIRMLTSSWSSNDIKSLISEYELTSTLKELSDAADLARLPASNVVKDLEKLRKSGFLCNLELRHSNNQCHRVHLALFTKRTGISLARKTTSSETKNKDIQVVESSFPAKVDAKAKFLYNYNNRTLTVESKHPSSHGYVEKWIAHIYGQSCWMKITARRPLSLVVEKRKDFIEEMPNTEKSTFPNDSLKFLHSVSGNLALTNNEETDKEEECDLFLQDFCTDLKDLWFSANITGDVKVVFTVPSPSSRFLSKPTGFSCHSFVLASRSTFFKTALSKHRKALEEMDGSEAKQFVTIEVDWKVFSPRYVQVVLYAMYTDQVDLQRIVKDFCVSVGHNRSQIDAVSDEVKDLTELLYLGKFLDFPMLVQGCESALSQALSMSNIESLLRWSSQPHGSVWLRRQIIRYIRDNFLQLSLSGVLNSLSCDEMCEVIRSDFINSPELDILRSVLKWGECELFRRIELREPNLVRSHVILSQANRSFRSTTSQSLSSRRRDILLASNTEELHECTSTLLSHVRLRHVLPANHEVLTSAIKRGVISCPPEHLLEWHHHAGVSSHNENTFFWLREKAGLGFLPPRLFLPHVEEARAILEERLCSEQTGNVNLRSVRKTGNAPNPAPGTVPDALYMVGQLRNPTYTHNASCDKCRRHRIGVTSLATRRLKYIDGTYPVPKPSLAVQLLSRERSLRQTAWLKRVLQLCHVASTSLPHCCCRSERNSSVELDGSISPGILCNLCRAERYVRLLVVREHGLPDVAGDLLRRPHLYYDPDDMAGSPPPPPAASGSRIPEVHATSASSSSSSGAPRKLQKLFQKRSAPRKSCAVPENLDITKTWETREEVLSSGSEQSLSDGSVDWHFPYNGADKKGCGIPGSSFWGSDSSIASIQKMTSVPDVAASAHSTIRSNNSRFSSSSSGSSRHGDNLDDSDLTRHGSITMMRRRTPASSYSQYLSLNRRRSDGAGSHRDSNSNSAGDSTPNFRSRGLRNPIPQLVLDGTLRRDESPDIFADTTNSLERDATNQSVSADHVTRTNVSKETCL